MPATEKAGARPGNHATALLAEADRLMTVCNSCRYCEGLCAVFPAMEMRRAFPGRRPQLPRQSLPLLRRLLRRLPVLAAARVRRQRAARAGAGARRVLCGLCVAARARADVCAQWPGDQPGGGVERRGLHSRVRGVARRERAVRHAHRAGRVLPADAAQRDGGAVRARRSSTRSSRSRWACGRSGATSATRPPLEAGPLWQAIRDAATACAISMAAASAATITTNGRTTGANSIIT